MLKDIPGQILSNKYIIRFAQNEDDVQAAQKLRYSVFNIELGEGLDSSHREGLDIDIFDEQCNHLLVIERESENVIGTYRMQTYDAAQKYHGLYTADEFDLSGLPDELLRESVELGRACIAKEHRNGRVLYLLWKGIAEFIKITSTRYLFGCCSLTSTNPKDGWITMDYLRHKGHIHEKYFLKTRTEYNCPEVERDDDAWNKVTLPKLFRLYIDMGAEILSQPALDRHFKTIDFFIIVDTKKLDERTKTLFFR